MRLMLLLLFYHLFGFPMHNIDDNDNDDNDDRN